MRKWNGRGAIAIAVAAGLVARGLMLRRRAGRLAVLEAADVEPDPDHVFLVAHGVDLDDATRRAASSYARREGLDTLALVSEDVDVEAAAEMLVWTNPETYRTSPLAPCVAPAQALLVNRHIAERAQLAATEDLDPSELAGAAQKAKRYAPRTSDLAVAPDLRAQPLTPAQRSTALRNRFDFAASHYLGLETLEALVLGLGVGSAVKRRNPVLLAPFLAYALEPLLAFTGKAIRPADLSRRTWGRWPGRVAALVGVHRGLARQDPQTKQAEDGREMYWKQLANGTKDFFEPRRPDCFLCGSVDLSVLVTATDLNQNKPGHFVLERCGTCGHVFQNPRLSADGLDFYYGDFYDGLGERSTELLLSTSPTVYLVRAQTVEGIAEPRRWLDIGTGYGYFCLFGREQWPNTSFDGLDLGESIQEAERRRWVDRAYRGQFPDLAGELAGQYDVVSMFHYLEHTVDPSAELDAAAKVLAPGGVLVVELPNPDSTLGRLLGRWWLPWLQPQHLHMLSIGNLENLLAEYGFTLIASEQATSHQTNDLVSAVSLIANRLAPPVDRPWSVPSTPWSRVKRHAALALATPFLAAAGLADQVLAPLITRFHGSNTYRVLARREG